MDKQLWNDSNKPSAITFILLLDQTNGTNVSSDETSTSLEEMKRSFIESFCISIPVCSCTPTDKQPCKITIYIHNNTTTNTTTNNKSTPPKYQRNEATLVYASVTMLSSFLGIVGNACVLLIAYKNRSNLPPCKLLIAQLAVVNFMFCVVQMVVTIPLYWTNVWIYELPMCKIFRLSITLFLLYFFNWLGFLPT